MIQPLLRSAPTGLYVDIGMDAGSDALTVKLSALGWHGVSIVPAATLPVRPNHVILPGIQAALAELANHHGQGTIHLLQVATGGTLSDLDITHARPWLILVQSSGPAGWIEALLANNYRVLAQEAGCWCFAADERYAAMTQHDDAGSAGVAGRLLDAARAMGALRTVASERADTVIWQRGVLDEAQGQMHKLRAEIAWVLSQLDEQQRTAHERGEQILALTRETAWLRGCVADATAALDEAQNAQRISAQRLETLSAEAEIAAQSHAQAQAASAGQLDRAVQALVQAQGELSRRLTSRIARRVRRVLQPATPVPEAGIVGSAAESASAETAPESVPVEPAAIAPPHLEPSITVMAVAGRWLADPVIETPEPASVPAPMPLQSASDAIPATNERTACAASGG